MARRQKRYHFIYKTTNNLSGKYYIGMHSTDDLDDGYLGSGRRLKYSLNKYGKENHTREILEYCDSREELKSREEEIVNLNEITKVDCMNLVVGGQGGFDNFISFYDKIKNDDEFRQKWINNIKRGLKESHENGRHWTGRTHTKASKKKIKDSNKGMGIGHLNSQYNTSWVNKDGSNIKVNKTEIEYYLNNGWMKGCVSSIPSNIMNEIMIDRKTGLSYGKLSYKYNIPKNTIRDNIIKYGNIDRAV